MILKMLAKRNSKTGFIIQMIDILHIFCVLNNISMPAVFKFLFYGRTTQPCAEFVFNTADCNKNCMYSCNR